MASGTLFTGTLQISKLNKQAKEGHSAFYKGKDGNIYVNVKMWLNDEPDSNGFDVNVQLNPKKDQETEKVYVGNLKKLQAKEQPVTSSDLEDIPEDDDLPF